MSITVEPAEVTWEIDKTLKLSNTTDTRLAFKIKTSDNVRFVLSRSHGFVEPKSEALVIIKRMEMSSNDDKLSVLWIAASTEESDPKEPFKGRSKSELGRADVILKGVV